VIRDIGDIEELEEFGAFEEFEEFGGRQGILLMLQAPASRGRRAWGISPMTPSRFSGDTPGGH
jgi:hypothetical protein